MHKDGRSSSLGVEEDTSLASLQYAPRSSPENKSPLDRAPPSLPPNPRCEPEAPDRPSRLRSLGLAVWHARGKRSAAAHHPAGVGVANEADSGAEKAYYGTDGEEHISPKADYSGFVQKSSPEEIRLVRKLDIYIMSTAWLMNWFNCLDRNAIAIGRLSSLEKNLSLTDTQYQTCIALFSVGYCLSCIPGGMVLTRVNPAGFLTGLMLLWSALSILTAFTHNFGQLVAVRFLLGLCEAPFNAGIMYIFANFYTRTEIATRIAIIHTGMILATAFAGLIAIGIFKLDTKLGYAGWQWLFIIQGAATGLVAICVYPFLANTPSTTRWLKPHERDLATKRLLRDRVDETEPGSVFKGLREAVSDPRVWLFCLMQNMHLSASGFKNFMPSVVQSLGFDREITLLLTCPPYVLGAVISIAMSLTSGRYNERTWHISVSKAVAILGFALAPASLNTAVRYTAMMIFVGATYGSNSISFGWAATVCAQSKEKKAVVMAMLTSISHLSFIYTPYLFVKTDAPRYTIAMSSMAAFSFACGACAWIMRFILKNQNKTLARTGSPTKYPY